MIGYCTNVHAGAGLSEMLLGLDTHAVAVRDRLGEMVSESECGESNSLGLGLWLSADSARELSSSELEKARLREWFAARRFVPYTVNAFPYGDFHRTHVKHAVYRPEWWTDARTEYTLDVANVLDSLLGPGRSGTISTLPIGWPQRGGDSDRLAMAARQFGVAASGLAEIESRSGRHIRLCIEPEPGCLLQLAGDVVEFFQLLRKHVSVELVDRYLGVCHDICHSVVMFESQDQALEAYQSANISIGKVQVSSAIIATLESSDDGSSVALDELRAFAEDRYLHQTMVRVDGQQKFYEDLPMALAASNGRLASEWRVHFHVPLFLERFGRLTTSQFAINECLAALKRRNLNPSLEVETYAWSVLPSELQQMTLAEGIAREISWLKSRL